MRTLLSSIWLDIFFVLLGITAVWLSRLTLTLPRFVPPEQYSDQLEKLLRNNPYVAELTQLGFTYVGAFESQLEKLNTGMMCCYISPDRRHFGAIVSVIPNRTPPTLEFTCDFTPEACINTSNTSGPALVPRPPTTLRVKTPWIKDTRRLWELHGRLCKAGAEEKFLVSEPSVPYEEAVLADFRRELDRGVETGRLKIVDSTRYRMTLRSALVMVPVVWFQMMYGILFAWFRRSDRAVVAGARRRFRKIRLARPQGRQPRRGPEA